MADTDWTQCPGDLDENGVRTGMGHLEIPNGSTYDGSFDKVMCLYYTPVNVSNVVARACQMVLGS